MSFSLSRGRLAAELFPAARRRFAPGLLGALALAGCGGSGGDSSAGAVAVVGTATPTPSPTPTPAPAPTPTPTPSPTPTSGTAGQSEPIAGLDPIPSNFTVADYLVKSWGTGDIPGSAASDGVGAFRFVCTPSHNAYDDPVVYPGQPGKSHLHTFFGNTGANANSTYQSLRTSGESTCNNKLNRSAYWVPALMNGAGKVVMPNYVQVYYKRMPDTDPNCQVVGKACVALPRGLRYIFGYNMSNPAASSRFDILCVKDDHDVNGPYTTIAEAAKGCPAGGYLEARLSAPSCWNGRDLDSADHRSHMAFSSYGNWGYAKCPDTHPYVIPTFTLSVFYAVDDTLDRSGNTAVDAKTWYFSSDRMAGMDWKTPGNTFHADWFGAWDDSAMKMWTDNCINKLLSCSGGDLGNGQQLRPDKGYSWPSTTQLVDAPST